MCPTQGMEIPTPVIGHILLTTLVTLHLKPEGTSLSVIKRRRFKLKMTTCAENRKIHELQK